eukprot:1150171-Pelagomonas_calceolata.AAC.8
MRKSNVGAWGCWCKHVRESENAPRLRFAIASTVCAAAAGAAAVTTMPTPHGIGLPTLRAFRPSTKI